MHKAAQNNHASNCKKTDPFISVVIPTYKGSLTLERALNGVLRQEYHNWEIIVVDDNELGSEERHFTAKIMTQYQADNVHYVQLQEKANASVARNKGIRKAIGSYIALLDDDDEWQSDKLKKQAQKIKTLGDEYFGCYTNYYKIAGDGSRKQGDSLLEGNLHKEVLMMTNSIGASSTMLIKKKCIDEIGGFDEGFERHQDYEVLVRLFRKFKIALIDQPLVHVYVSHTKYDRKFALRMVQVKKKFLAVFREDIRRYGRKTQGEIYSKHFMEMAKMMKKNQLKMKSLTYCLKAIFHYPSDIKIKVKFLGKLFSE